MAVDRLTVSERIQVCGWSLEFNFVTDVDCFLNKAQVYFTPKELDLRVIDVDRRTIVISFSIKAHVVLNWTTVFNSLNA